MVGTAVKSKNNLYKSPENAFGELYFEAKILDIKVFSWKIELSLDIIS